MAEGTKKDQFEDALLALRDLYAAVGRADWIGPIEEDISNWRRTGSGASHLGRYGGMGWINDVWSPDPWLGPLIDPLLAICFLLARSASASLARIEADANSAPCLGGWRCMGCKRP